MNANNILKFAKLFEKQAQSQGKGFKTKQEGKTVTEAVLATPGLKNALLDIMNKIGKDATYYAWVQYHLVPIANEKAPPGVPPKEWTPKYDKTKSSAAAYITVDIPDGDKIYVNKKFNELILNIICDYFQTPTSNPEPPRYERSDTKKLFERIGSNIKTKIKQ